MCWYHADHDKNGIRMVIIVCLDQKNGMRFNHRRLSRDREIIKDIYKMLLDAPLYMSSQSQILFEDYGGKIVVDPKFMEKSDMFCFVETSDFDTHKVDEINVYRFDTVYPADEYFPIDLNEYILMEESEFKGYSHDVITKEIYSKIM